MAVTRILRQPLELSGSLNDRLYGRSTCDPMTGCWIWNGCVSRTGYGKIKVAKECFDVHVVSWRLANGGISVPVGLLVMHTCGNRKCINPDHLQVGDTRENMRQAAEAGFLGLSRGDDRHNAVLTEEIVRVVRGMYVRRRVGAFRIAAELGLKPSCVQEVLSGRNWKHVQ